jgi:hypothetical protein
MKMVVGVNCSGLGGTPQTTVLPPIVVAMLNDPTISFSMPVPAIALAKARGFKNSKAVSSFLKAFGEPSTGNKWCHVGRANLECFFFTRGALSHVCTVSSTYPFSSPSSLLPHLPFVNLKGGRLLGTESDGSGRLENAKLRWRFCR